jgi:uncharacterized protein with NRDE domain
VRIVCTLAVYVQQSPALPLVVAANRDEFYARPATAPRLVSVYPWVVAGQDLSAGGTWLGVNAHQLVVGLLNRRRAQGPDPSRQSRGLLCLAALQTPGLSAALELVRRVRAADYNWFNMLLADPREAHVATNLGDVLTIRRLEPGLHLLTNLEVNDPTCPRIARSYQRFAELPLRHAETNAEALLSLLRPLLADHAVPLDPRADVPGNTLCSHGDVYGTRSSAIVAHEAARQRLRYWHADGPPCSTAYQEIALPS